MGSPPPEGSKKDVFRFRSVRSIVIAPARTERDRRRRMAAMRIAQTRNGTLSIRKFLWCILIIVEMKLIARRMEDIPAMWREKIVRSIDGPL